jgi:malic enzyme
MNRLAPLISRRTRQPACFAIAAPRASVEVEQAARWVEDVKLFAAGWVSGLVIFGTLIA